MHVHNIAAWMWTCALAWEPCPTDSLLFVALRTHINQARVVSLSQVVQHRGFVEAGEVGHVLHFAEAWGVHSLHLLPGQSNPPLAVCQLHLHLIAALLPNAGRLQVEGEREVNKRHYRRRRKSEFPFPETLNLVEINKTPQWTSRLHFNIVSIQISHSGAK